MPYLPTAQAFLEQSTLLISARPTTARVTSKYTIPHPDPPANRHRPSRNRLRSPPTADEKSPTTNTTTTTTATSSTKPSNPERRLREHHRRSKSQLQPTLVIKTYDPVSGTCLKYRTDKAAEVGRLVANLGTCGRVMAALPLPKLDVGSGRADGGLGGGGIGGAEGPMEGLHEEGGAGESTNTATTTNVREELKAPTSSSAGPASKASGSGAGAGDAPGTTGGGANKKKKKGKR